MVSLKKLCASALVLCMSVCALNETARAVTLGGKEYTEMLQFKTAGDFGYWPGPDKYFTFRGDDDKMKPLNITTTSFRAPELNGVKFGEVFAMGTTAFDYGPVNSGVVSLTDNKGNKLLTANVETGSVTSVIKPGFAGQLDVFASYATSGGSLAGIFGDAIYVTIAFDYVWQAKYKDLKTTAGTWTFYKQVGGGGGCTSNCGGGGNPVPEPTTVAMLLSGLAGSRLARRRAAKK